MFRCCALPLPLYPVDNSSVPRDLLFRWHKPGIISLPHESKMLRTVSKRLLWHYIHSNKHTHNRCYLGRAGLGLVGSICRHFARGEIKRDQRVGRAGFRSSGTPLPITIFQNVNRARYFQRCLCELTVWAGRPSAVLQNGVTKYLDDTQAAKLHVFLLTRNKAEVFFSSAT